MRPVESIQCRRGATRGLVPTMLAALLLSTTSAFGVWARTSANAGHTGDGPGLSRSCSANGVWQATCTSDARCFHSDGTHNARGYAYATSYWSIYGWQKSTSTSMYTPNSGCWANAKASAGRWWITPGPIRIIGPGDLIGVPIHVGSARLAVAEVAGSRSSLSFDVVLEGASVASGSAQLTHDGFMACTGFFIDSFFDVQLVGDHWEAEYIGPPMFEVSLPVGVDTHLDHVMTSESESTGPCPTELPETILAMEATLPDGYMIKGEEFHEDFEPYNATDKLPDQSSWESWDDDADAAEFYTTEDESRSGSASVVIDGDDDAVHRFGGYTEGAWDFTVWSYIPLEFNEISNLILLNTYPALENNDWSLQVGLDGGAGVVRDLNTGDEVPLVKGQWAEFRVLIDLDQDTQHVYYNGIPLVTKGWTDGVEPGGDLNIGAVDLWANGTGMVYYDDVAIAPSAGIPCPGDTNGDGVVTFADILTVLGAWGSCP